MSITRAAMRALLDIITDHPYKGTTSGAGEDDKKSFVDEGLGAYPDRWFKNKSAYLPATSEERITVGSHAPEGVIQVSAPFASVVAITTAYEIHSIPGMVALKNDALNKALRECFPRYYKYLVDETLVGKGSGDNTYSIPVAFAREFPSQLWLKRVNGTKTELTLGDVDYFLESDGVRKFVADISPDYTIRLVGRATLTQFTTDVSTTELSETQADVVCYKAAALLYMALRGERNSAEDVSRYEGLQQEKEMYYEVHSRREGMPAIRRRPMRITWA